MQSLTARELADRLSDGGIPAPLLLDVREPWETAVARLDRPTTEALYIPMMQVPQRLADIDRARPVVCICHHGVRSAQVVAFLLQQGYPSVYNLTGGLDAWSRDIDPGVARY